MGLDQQVYWSKESDLGVYVFKMQISPEVLYY